MSGEFASNAKANTAVTLASVLGGIGTYGALRSGALNGLLGGCDAGCGARYGAGLGMGAELQYVSELQARVQSLEAEKVANTNMVAAFNQTVANDKELRAEMYAYIKPLAEEAANNRVHIARLEEQQKCCREKQELCERVLEGKLREQGLALNGKIDTVAQTAKCCCEQNSAAIAGLQALMSKITQTSISTSAICPEVMPRYNSWTAPTTTTPAA
nr:MAG TPA: hypothetical protein [Caudoviricetes sp.]